jgi:hypothetical protein
MTVVTVAAELLHAKGINFENEAEAKWVTSDDRVDLHPYVGGLQCDKRLVRVRQKQKEADLKKMKKRWDKDSGPAGSSNPTHPSQFS